MQPDYRKKKNKGEEIKYIVHTLVLSKQERKKKRKKKHEITFLTY